MGEYVFGFIMFICIVPTLWILYFYLYPKKWREKKRIYGVNNRKEFEKEEIAKEIDQITAKTHKQAQIITLVCTAFSLVLLFFKGWFLQTFTWTLFIFLALFIDTIPYIIGHKEMMTVKKSLGITQDKGLSYVDLKTAANIHALRPIRVILPNLVAFLLFTVMLLADLKVITPPSLMPPGTFMGTMLAGTYMVIGFITTLGGFLMDRLKNDVISTDTDVNANYNRAKKKCWADLFTGWIWLNDLYLLVVVGICFFCYSDMLFMVSMTVYLIAMMVSIAFFVRQSRKIEARYQKETILVSDDDEYWLAGMFYCNPADRRIMVEKRAGVGGTINLGHPIGKLIGILSLLVIIGSLMSIVWVGVVEATPIRLSVTDKAVICHQLRDEYVIPLETIESAEWGDDITEHNLYRTSGVGMDNLLKGNFAVDNQPGCKVFLAPLSKAFICIKTTDGKTYYVSGSTAEETQAAFEALQ